MAVAFRIFRLFGKFNWPPVVGAPSAADPVPGVVEICFQEKDGRNHAYFVWTRADKYEFGKKVEDPPIAASANVFLKTANDLVALFGPAQAPVDGCALWIEKPTSPGGTLGSRLRFDGAFLFDQFAAPTAQSNAAEDRELRWPLLRSFRYKDGTNYYSGVTIGQASDGAPNDKFRLCFGLGMPVRQTIDEEDPKALTFATVHDPVTVERAKCGEIATFIAGTTGRQGWNKSFAGNRDAKRLGRFGLAPNATPAGPIPHVTYREYVKGEDLPLYWPLEDATSIHGILQSIGIKTDLVYSVKEPSVRRCKTPNDKNDSGVRITFRGNGFTYRSVLQATGASAGEKYGDIHLERISSEYRFNLRAKSEVGGWITTGSDRLHFCIKCDWEIDDEHVRRALAADAPDWNATVVLNLLSEYNAPQELERETTPTTVDGLPLYQLGDLLIKANITARLARSGLLAIAAAQPQSLVPTLRNASAQRVWLSLAAIAFSARLPFSGQLILTPNIRPSGDRFRLSLAEAEHAPHSNTPVALRLDLFLPFFNNTVKLGVQLEGTHGKDNGGALQDDFFAAFKIVQPNAGGNFEGRLGALTFSTAGLVRDSNDKDYSWLRISGWTNRADGRGPRLDGATAEGAGRTCPAAVAVQLRLAVTKITPSTVDLPHGQRSQKRIPLIIEHTDAEGTPAAASFTLVAREDLAGNDDRHLVAHVIEHTVTADPNRSNALVDYTLLADEPFSLMRFSRVPLHISGDVENAIVATFDSDERTWAFKLTLPEYRYTLPAQSVGESSDKPRRLEIQDLPDDGTAEPIVRPYPVYTSGSGGGVDLRLGSDQIPVHSRLVEFRLTPSANLWIKPSDLERGYFLPEWAAHEIFRGRNDFGLGAALLRFSAEFLYGLSVGVDARKERGPARLARVAEIEALTGALPAERQVASADSALFERWRSLRQAMKRRHERLELWTADYGGARPFAPARFSDGVSFALRRRALYRPPVPLPEDDGTEVLPPSTIVGGNEDTSSSRPRFHNQGLAGGALWPLESWNVLKALLEKPESNGGTIERIALSPTGGDADQTARFLNGVVSIISETRGGFVQRQRVEILGRVGVFWHRAKHVVVYERTVNPTAQFAPSEKDDPKHTRTRRAVIRKVAEFVELLQPRRNYPDDERAPARSVGFLDSLRFNSIRINVDSTWGTEIGTVGYELPLWNRESARQRPQVYPRPDVSFVTMGDGAEERPLVAQECLDPENLYFFCDIQAGTADTDAWPSRLGIDRALYVDLKEPDPDPVWPRLGNVSRIVSGFRRFTWRLAPGSSKTELNATRGTRPVYAGLESITFMRLAEEASAQKRTALQEIHRAIGPAGDKIKVLREATAEMPEWLPGSLPGGTHAVASIAQQHAALEGLIADVAEKRITDIDLAQQAYSNLKSALGETNLLPKLAKQTAALEGFAKDLKSNAEGIIGAIENGERSCERFAEEAVEAIRRKRLLISENVRIAQSDLKTWIGGLDFATPAPINAKELKLRVIEQAKDIARWQLRPMFGQANRDFGGLRRDIEQARAVALDTQADIELVLKRTLGRLDALRASYHDGTPWSTNRVREFERRLVAIMSSVDLDIDAAVREAQQRLATELGALGHQVGAIVGRALEQAATLHAKLADRPVLEQGELLSGAQQVVARMRAALVDVARKLDEIGSQLAKAREKDRKAKFGPAIAKIQAVLDRAKASTTALRSQVDEAEKIALAKLDDLNGRLATLATAAQQLVTDVAARIADIETATDQLVDQAKQAGSDIFQDVGAGIKAAAGPIKLAIQDKANWTIATLKEIGAIVDPVVNAAAGRIEPGLRRTAGLTADVLKSIDDQAAAVADGLKNIEVAFGSDRLTTAVCDGVVGPATQALLDAINDNALDNLLKEAAQVPQKAHQVKGLLVSRVDQLADQIAAKGGLIDQVTSKLFEGANEIGNVCQTMASLRQRLEGPAAALLKDVQGHLAAVGLDDLLKDASKYADALSKARKLGDDLRRTMSGLRAASESAKAYGDRLLEGALRLEKGRVGAAPNNFLKLYSAATSSPELAMLEMNIDRVRSTFDEVKDAIDMTKASALFSRLGDALKALGLDLPIDGLSDGLRIDTASLTNSISRHLRNFGGVNLDGLLRGVDLGQSFADGIRVSHDFDKKQARAWVQIDINGTLPGRSELFAIGPFALYFRESQLSGEVRLEASKDTEQVQESGFSRIQTTIEAVISGQTILTLESVQLHYSREEGLKFHVDSKNIRLNEVFRFIQETLATLFPDKVGALTVIKDQGVPIGVEHEFTTPNLGVMAGTSGVTNIEISNKFRLVAFPDFVIANRFNLSSAERPFLFSIFIIGGAGYVQVDTEYRPFDGRLLVVVEAAAGGSAALGFTVGPVSGSVFIALSVAITYRKMPEERGGGVAISLMLVIAGDVSLWGIASIHLGLVLRMTYRDNGQIDGNGTLSVSVTVCRFLKLRFRTDVSYKLRDGRSTTSTETSMSADVDPARVKAIEEKMKRLEGVRRTA